MFSELSRFLDQFLELGVPGYDCVIYHHGECVFRRFRGVSDVERQIPMNGKERYNLYSCTKPVTCTAALQLYEQGAFSLDDPIERWLPEFSCMTVQTPSGPVPAHCSIRVKDLFMMTAGFSYDLDSPALIRARQETGGRCPTRTVMEYLAQEPLLFQPGTSWHYSLCHDVLAALVEVLSGQRFGAYLQEHIFRPLGMDRSALHGDDRDPAIPLYFYQGSGKPLRTVFPGERDYVTYRLGPAYDSGGAGLISTVDDYIRFLEALRTGAILKPETVALMQTDHLSNLVDPTLRRTGYGLGVRCRKAGSDQPREFGWDGAGGAYLTVDLEQDFTLFYAQHLAYSPNGFTEPRMTHRLHEIAGRALAANTR